MTFEEFQASGRDLDDLRTIENIGDAFDEPTPGRAYACGLHIETYEPSQGGAWCLTIGRDTSISDDLRDLERKLYHYALSEDLFPPTGKNEAALCDELREFCTANDLPQECADDLLMCAPLAQWQRNWLQKFCARWDEVVVLGCAS